MADPRALFGDTRLPEFLGGRRVDYYIPPEVRQGIGALLQVGDMLNPVSAYREYIRDVGEGDVAGAATNLAGFVAPGAAGAIASRLGRAGIMAIEPYSDDAARALMEMLSPTGAPDDISRRQFMAGAGAAALAPLLPSEELLKAAGRTATRGGVGLSGRLGALAGLRREMSELDEFLEEPRQLRNALNRVLREAQWSPDILMTRDTAEAKDRLVRETRERLDDFEDSYGPMFDKEFDISDKIVDGGRDLVADIARNAEAFADELGDLSDDELRGLADQIEYVMNNPSADLPVYDLKGSEGEDIVGLFDRNMGGFADRLEAEAARRGLEDVRLYGLREYLWSISDARYDGVRSGGVDEFGFVPDDFGISPRMVGGVEDFGFRQDNPAVSRGATDWLANKQRIADEDYENFRGISGSITAELGQRRDSPMFLPTEFLRSLPGARGESRGPGDPRFDDLLATVRHEGFDPEQAGNRVVVGVNHRGEAFIVEGNTRTAVADVVGIPSVKAEVRYFNGGEEVAGPFAPSSIARIAASRPDLDRANLGPAGYRDGGLVSLLPM